MGYSRAVQWKPWEPAGLQRQKPAKAKKVSYGIRPEHLEIAATGIAAEVHVVEPMGAETEFLVKVQDQTLTLVTHGRAANGPGDRLFLAPQAQYAHLFDAASGLRIQT